MDKAGSTIQTPFELEAYLSQLLSNKDKSTEDFLRQLVDSLDPPAVASADETGRQWCDQAANRLSEISVTLSHRVAPLLQLLLNQKLNQSLTSTFGTLPPVQDSTQAMVKKYQKCFNTWVDSDDCVAFSTHNPRMLGTLHPKDVFVLTLFAFATCRRTKGDNILQLGIAGVSTCGKSTLFENPLVQGAHTMTNEPGVGRYNVGQKNLIFLHDIDLKTLVNSRDTEKFKTICRSEVTVAKVHSQTVTLPPLFLLYTCNQRLMNHIFPAQKSNFLGRNFLSQVSDPNGTRKESIQALQNRFLEAYCRRPPPLDPHDLPRSGIFQRHHFIMGTYARVMSILQRHSLDDFYSPTLAQYALMGLCLHLNDYLVLTGVQEARLWLSALVGRLSLPDQMAAFQTLIKSGEENGRGITCQQDEVHNTQPSL